MCNLWVIIMQEIIWIEPKTCEMLVGGCSDYWAALFNGGLQ